MNQLLKRSTRRHRDLFAAIDIGGSKICCAIAKVDDRSSDNALRIIGIGQQLSQGIKGGVITNLDELEDSILNAVHSAEQMAGERIEEVYINLAASTTQSHTLDVQMMLNGQMVDEHHIRRLLYLGRHDAHLESRYIVHALPIAYAIDDKEGIRDPRGLIGNELTATFHVVSTSNGVLQNLINCIGRCHLDVVGVIATPYASGLSTLVEDEVELGVTVIDLGGGQCSIASFLEGALIHLDYVGVGSSLITSDIARGLSTPLAQAERLKTLYGTALTSSSDERETIVVPPLGEGLATQNHHVPKSMLTHIIRSRVEEMLELIWKRLQESGMDRLVCQRIVLTGGGSQLPGIREVASTFWSKQIRIGHPLGVNGGGDIVNNPSFATCAGMLKYAWRDYLGGQEQYKTSYENSGIWQRLVNWVRDNF
jgi:cell division protein FtsA